MEYHPDAEEEASGEEGHTVDFSAHPMNPWSNQGADGLPTDSQDQFDLFVNVMKNCLRGTRLSFPFEAGGGNMYLALGFGEAGFDETSWNYVSAHLKTWCDHNDERHPRGWILMVIGEPSVAKRSIHTMAEFVEKRGVPVVMLMSDFDYVRPEEMMWPAYASAVYFGPGVYHDAINAQEPQPCRGGFARDGHGVVTQQMSFPDACILGRKFEGYNLAEHIAGVFAAGGGREIQDQLKIHRVSKAGRDKTADTWVRASDASGRLTRISRVMPSPLMRFPNRQGAIFGRPGTSITSGVSK